MSWNWQKKQWPNFKYENTLLARYESEFLYAAGVFMGSLKCISKEDQEELKVNLLSNEAFKTSEIEGELLDRDSLQSSMRRNFALESDQRRIPAAEKGITEMMLDLYRNFDKPLSHNLFYEWNSMIMLGRRDLKCGHYRQGEDPMQVVSGPIHNPKIHFEAPASGELVQEMESFNKWFNDTAPTASNSLPALVRAGIAHLYFVCIHPFEDGNGRIARALAEKSLSQYLGQATLISLSTVIEKQRKRYYRVLDESNRDLEITAWLEYFSETILQAQAHSQSVIEFTLKKAKFYRMNHEKLNPRQSTILARIFQEGVEGFKGGLSAENYVSITKTSRATATRDLQDLLDKKIMYKTGKLKSTRYYLEGFSDHSSSL